MCKKNPCRGGSHDSVTVGGHSLMTTGHSVTEKACNRSCMHDRGEGLNSGRPEIVSQSFVGPPLSPLSVRWADHQVSALRRFQSHPRSIRNGPRVALRCEPSSVSRLTSPDSGALAQIRVRRWPGLWLFPQSYGRVLMVEGSAIQRAD